MDHEHPSHEGHPSNRRSRLILIGFLLVSGYFLISEHRAHLGGMLSYLPFLLLLACPLMHVFMHHGHRGRNASAPSSDRHEEQK